MSQRKVDLQKVYEERVKPELSPRDAEKMESAIAAPPFRALYTNVAGKIHWYLLGAPSRLYGKHFGVAINMEDAQRMISGLLGSTKTNRAAIA